MEVIGLLGDRTDGLALLADSLAETGAVGRCRDFFRLFERAFKRDSDKLIPPLSTFLESNPRHDALAFSHDEVRHWVKIIRPMTIHADRSKIVGRNPEVEPYLGRMESAAYDVLFNKRNWRQPSAQRQQRVTFMSGVSKDRFTQVALQLGATIYVRWIDPFGVFPIDHSAPASVDDRDGWIWRLPGDAPHLPSASTPTAGLIGSDPQPD